MQIATIKSFTSDLQSNFIKPIVLAMIEQDSQGKMQPQSQAEVWETNDSFRDQVHVLWCMGTWDVSRYHVCMTRWETSCPSPSSP